MKAKKKVYRQKSNYIKRYWKPNFCDQDFTTKINDGGGKANGEGLIMRLDVSQ